MYMSPTADQPDSISCVPTATKMALNQATAGVKDPTVYQLRAAVGDFSGGMSYLQMVEAVYDVSKLHAIARYGVATGDTTALVEAGHPCVISIDTNVTYPYPEVRTGYFRGGHSLHLTANGFSVWPGLGERCVCERRTTDRHGEFTYEDPGTYSVGYRRISASLLYRAALARSGNGGVNLLVLPDVLGISRKCVADGWVRKHPTTTAAKHSALVVGHVYDLREPVSGSRWRRANGTYSTGWWQTNGGYFIRADKLAVTNA